MLKILLTEKKLEKWTDTLSMPWFLVMKAIKDAILTSRKDKDRAGVIWGQE
jgi:hypothetical protein